MQKYLFGLVICLLLLPLSGCSNDESVEDLKIDIIELENKIDRCNDQIEDAKSYAGGDYGEIQEALENLEVCN